jgi:uridine phosphorylase
VTADPDALSFYEDGDPHVEPHLLVDYLCKREGIAREQLGVRPAVLGTFSSRLTEYLATVSGAVRAEHWLRRMESNSFLLDDSVGIVTLPVGAPTSSMLVEEMIVCGMRSLIVTGAAGSLQPEAPIGTIVLPTSAIREEGTSHHYTSSREAAVPSPRLLAALEAGLRRRDRPYVSGPTWTTDGVYMEHKSKIERYRAAGIVTVEMELSALLTVAAYRGIECAGLFVVSDELHRDTWEMDFGGPTFGSAMGEAALIALEAVKALTGT